MWPRVLSYFRPYTVLQETPGFLVSRHPKFSFIQQKFEEKFTTFIKLFKIIFVVQLNWHCDSLCPFLNFVIIAMSCLQLFYCLPLQINGMWSEWSDWTSCSESCGRGTRRRYRKCNNPAPIYGGKPCLGADGQQEYCNQPPCPVHGKW